MVSSNLGYGSKWAQNGIADATWVVSDGARVDRIV